MCKCSVSVMVCTTTLCIVIASSMYELCVKGTVAISTSSNVSLMVMYLCWECSGIISILY